MFKPGDIETFRVTSCSFDEPTGTAVFGYALDDEVHFSETYTFPVGPSPLDSERRAALDRALQLLAITAGVSYYKAAAPAAVSIETCALTSTERRYFERLYSDGLGEFYFKNNLNPAGPSDWRASTARDSPARPLDLNERALVAIGGGKDSCVSTELVRRLDTEVLLASINTARPIKDCITASGLPGTTATRSISKTLLELNQQGAYNGHVPVTAIVSFALIALAIIKNCNAVVLSNERSASIGNLNWRDHEINHQWAKSFEAELLIAEVVRKSVANNLDYFSLLRPYSELHIAKLFAQTDTYDSAFTSCNKAFRIDESRRIERWCGNCDKCRFVFLALAPNAAPQRLQRIFGADLLKDETQISGFEALCGWNANKPFECVGEVEESIAAFKLLSNNPQWSNHRVVEHITNEVLEKAHFPEDVVRSAFKPSSDHQIPKRFQAVLNADPDTRLNEIPASSQPSDEPQDAMQTVEAQP